MSLHPIQQLLQPDIRYRFFFHSSALNDTLQSADGYFNGVNTERKWLYYRPRKGAYCRLLNIDDIVYIEPTAYRRKRPKPRVYEKMSPAIRLTDSGELDMMATLQTLFTASA